MSDHPVPAPRPDTLCAAFQHTASIDPDAVALRIPGGGHSLTWGEYADQVRDVAAGLAGLGVGRGDTVALMMANRVEFYPLEVGAQHVGATSFSVYNTLSAEQLGHVLGNAGARVVICEAPYVDRLRASGADLDHIVCVDLVGVDGAGVDGAGVDGAGVDGAGVDVAGVDGAPDGVLSVADLVAGGAADFDFDAAWRAVRPEDVATLIYTSGTTGNPKGVETTHANLLFEAFAFVEVLSVEFGDRITSFLPSAHIADRFTALYLHEVFGTQITAVADPRQVVAALPDVRPTVWGAVPRVWEKLKAAIEHSAAAEPDETRRHGLLWALAVARARGAAELAGEPMSEELAADWARADAAVLSPLRRKIGLDQVRWTMSGAAPIPPETLAFFSGLGIPIAEIWGMSELSCVASASHPRDARLGTVGRLLPGMEHRIAEDGEFLVRGPLVMKGYRKEPEKTAAAIDADGWLHTGDIITVDAEGFLRVVDRKKELIINASGKNMSPVNIENTIRACTPLVGGMATIGDGRPYNTALIVLDPEVAAGYAAPLGLSTEDPSALAAELAAHPEVIAGIAAGVAEGNAKLSRVEQVKRFTILPVFWEPGGEELTLTMKLRRKPISARYAEQIEGLYAECPGAAVHEPAAAVTA